MFNKDCDNSYFKSCWNKKLSDSFIKIINHLRKTYDEGGLKSQVAIPITVSIDDEDSKYKLKRLIDVPESINSSGFKNVLKIDEQNIYVSLGENKEEFQKVYFEKDGVMYLPYEAPTWYSNKKYKQEFRDMQQLEAFSLFVNGYTFINESLKMEVNLHNLPEELTPGDVMVKLKALGKYYN